MSTSLFDEPTVRPSTSPAQRLRVSTAAVRLAISWLGVRKTLTTDQKNQAAEGFGAQGNFLSAGKKLLDTTHPAFKAVTAVKNKSVNFWKSLSLPYTEPGIRLIRQDKIDMFDTQMRSFQDDLDGAVTALDLRYHDLKASAQSRLGRLYDPADYPESLAGLFAIDWDFPSVEPPDYLCQLNPQLYQQECERVQQRFDEAVQLAEQAFSDELSGLVEHLLERLTGQSDGKPKVFRDTAVTNLTEFFERFKQLNIRSNDDLDSLVERAQEIVQGRDPQELRDNHVLRTSVASELAEVQNVLDDLLVDRPRRNILRRPR
jgi:hypothetical protein